MIDPETLGRLVLLEQRIAQLERKATAPAGISQQDLNRAIDQLRRDLTVKIDATVRRT